MVLFLQNISRLCFLGFHNFKHLFYFSLKLYFIQGFSVVFIGLVIILSIGFFFKLRYLHGKKTKSFEFNLRLRYRWSLIQAIRFVLKPIL